MMSHLVTTLCDHLQKIILSVLIKLRFNQLNCRYRIFLHPQRPQGVVIVADHEPWGVEPLGSLLTFPFDWNSCAFYVMLRKGLNVSVLLSIHSESFFLVTAGHFKQTAQLSKLQVKQSYKGALWGGGWGGSLFFCCCCFPANLQMESKPHLKTDQDYILSTQQTCKLFSLILYIPVF